MLLIEKQLLQYINEKNNDKEDEINIYKDVNNVGDNSGNNNDENYVN